MENFNFNKQEKPDKPEVDDRDLPLQEIVPDNDSERNRYEINIIKNIIKDLDQKKKEDNKKQKKKPPVN